MTDPHHWKYEDEGYSNNKGGNLDITKLLDDKLRHYASNLCDFATSYELIENDYLGYYSDGNVYLNSPNAVRLFIKDSELFIGKEYGETLYLNKNGDGLEYRYDGTSVKVDNCYWIYLGYCTELENKIRKDW